ncbi:hypothetical protein FF38_05824 [Lucilia cuprina]|uniref:Uncharacterized protein n=1 Tax=Lucilia cuprina TaxID=7375 RepID=A0A0L0CMB1_LUCCU|nr:hypothetical protein FF38_05824 [Lucilia cuprina]
MFSTYKQLSEIDVNPLLTALSYEHEHNVKLGTPAPTYSYSNIPSCIIRRMSSYIYPIKEDEGIKNVSKEEKYLKIFHSFQLVLNCLALLVANEMIPNLVSENEINIVVNTANEAIKGKCWRNGSKEYCIVVTLDAQRNA